MNHFRPTRGAVRLDDLRFDVAQLEVDVAQWGADEYKSLNYGSAWAQIQIIRPDGAGGLHTDPRVERSPGLRNILDRLPGRCLDMSLARLGPGGAVANHRDISGGVPMGVGRFHVPVVTDPGVEFHVSNRKVFMGPGEAWNLDTSYVHRVANTTNDVWRVHVIVDVELTDEVRRMLPAEDWIDQVHKVQFSIICFFKGLRLLVRDPRALIRRVVRMFRLKVLGQSQLVFDE